MQTQIEWSQAIQEIKVLKDQQKQEQTEYKQSVSSAKDDFWDALGEDDFSFSDFSDICYMHGVDEDDLINSMI